MDKRKKILISQPMGERTAEEVRENRDRLVKALEEEGYEILDNVFMDEIPKDIPNQQIYYLGKAISLMCEADEVVFMDGWQGSRGCQIEKDIVHLYNIKHSFEIDHLQ